MAIRANADSKFLLKYLLIGIGCLAFGFWASYDAFVKVPAKLPISEAWEKLQADSNLDDGLRDAQYKQLAKEKGWPMKHPGADESVEALHQFVIWQYVFIGLGFGIGLPCLIWYFKNRGTWVESTDQGLHSSWGAEVNFDQIQRFDKKKWEKKGIGVLTYQNAGGVQKFVVDDLKYSRQEMDEIVRLIESRIKPEMIVNGAPEAVVANGNV